MNASKEIGVYFDRLYEHVGGCELTGEVKGLQVAVGRDHCHDVSLLKNCLKSIEDLRYEMRCAYGPIVDSVIGQILITGYNVLAAR